MTPAGSTRPGPLPGRYDRRPPARQRLLSVVLGTALAALIGMMIITLGVRLSTDAVSARILGYRVTSDSAVGITFEVDKEQGSRAYCIVRARGADGAEVGRDVAEVDTVGTDQRRVRRTFDLATSGRAVTGEVAGCSPEPISKD